MLDLGELLAPGAIALRVNASSKRQVLSIIADMAARTLDLPASDIAARLAARERLGSTGVGHGVAVPHARLRGLGRLQGVFARLESPVDFGSVDEQPVDLVFALLAPADHPAEHLRALAKVSRALRQADLREQLRHAHSADAVRALLVRDPPLQRRLSFGRPPNSWAPPQIGQHCGMRAECCGAHAPRPVVVGTIRSTRRSSTGPHGIDC